MGIGYSPAGAVVVHDVPTDALFDTRPPDGTLADYKGVLYVRDGGAWVTVGAQSGTTGVLLAEVALVASAATIDIQNIPAGYRGLEIVAFLRTDRVATVDTISVALNNDTTDANYDQEYSQAAGTAGTFVQTLAASGSRSLVISTAASSPAGAFSVARLWIPSYADATVNKVVQALIHSWETRSANGLRVRNAMMGWASTAAVNRITLVPVTGPNFVAGSKVQIYGKASGAPLA